MIQEFENTLYGKIRTSIIDDQPCFNLKDLCRLYEIKSVTECRSRLNDAGVKMASVPSEKGAQNMFFVTADNLAGCLFQSTKTEAELISDWLYRIVLPQLVKYGSYKVEDFHDPNLVVQFLDEYQDMKIKTNVMETRLKIDEPKIKAMNKLLGTNNCVDLDVVHEVIKFKGIQNAELLKVLRAGHVLNDNNKPLQEFCDMKYFRVVAAKVIVGGSVVTSDRVYVYQSGVSFVERMLKEYDGVKHGKTK
jgi:prophage antirepressor-like protein